MDKVRLNPGPLTRLWRFITDRGRRERAVHWPDSFTFDTPAQGDAYGFTVIVHFTWCITGREHAERLAGRAEDRHAELCDRLLAKLRPISRGFPPYEVADAERRIERAVWEMFSQTRFDYVTKEGSTGVALPIHGRTVLHLDKKVLEAQQDAWSRRQRAANDHEYAKDLMPKLSHRRELWQRFLRDGQQDWLTPYAVALAQDPEATASVVGAMFNDRHRQAKELSEELTRQTEKYGEVDAFELMMHNDTVLRRLVEVMGIPLAPQLEQGSFDDGRASNGEPST